VPVAIGARILDLGCGNGAFAGVLAERRYRVEGVDPSEQGIAIARQAHPGIEFHQHMAEPGLVDRLGRFRAVVSLEVVEHVYAPREFAACIHAVLEEGGVAIISTPYHGYLKNLVLALAGRFDAHVSPLWDHGHIKFWSMRTLAALLREAGFVDLAFKRVGRIPPLAKSMIVVARR
jgi:2-polyprenyl-6-hydroxyphenyl methylase/3-demethylubiquinone-9 3-methyltransferase